MDAETATELVKQIRLTVVETSLGVHPVKAVHGLCVAMRDLTQRGSMSLDELRETRARLGSWNDDHATGWADGYAEGMAVAILRVLEQRDVSVSDEIDGFLSTRTDLEALTVYLDLALTVMDARELFATGPGS